jgi:hypothetical protein
VTLSGYGATDLDLIAVGSSGTIACDPDGACLAASSTTNSMETVTIPLAAGQQVYVAVDGYAGASGTYSIAVSCP